MRVAITGANGYLGAHCTSAIVTAGHSVRVLVHPGDPSTAPLEALGVELDPADVVVGDVCDPDSVARLLDGCDAVLHAAGIVGVDDRDEALMWQVNVQGTATVLAAAVARRLDPIIHVASYSALFPSPDGVISPDSPSAPGRSAYGRTKSVADRIARGFQAAGAPVVVTYPSSVVGPPAGDRRGVTADGWAPLLRYGVSVSFQGGMSMIDVRDVADLHVALLEPGQGPRRVVCGGQEMPFDEVLDALELGLGRPIRRVRTAPRLLRGIGRLCDVAARLSPIPPGFSYEAAWLLTSAQPCDDRVALDLLGRPWRSVPDALTHSVRPDPPVTPIPTALESHR